MLDRLYEGDHPYVAHCLNGIGSCYLSLREHTKARPHLEEALAMFARVYGDADNLGAAKCRNNLGQCLMVSGKPVQESDEIVAYLVSGAAPVG